MSGIPEATPVILTMEERASVFFRLGTRELDFVKGSTPFRSLTGD
jgi:hypothetical protein